jgi:hypothetical protein
MKIKYTIIAIFLLSVLGVMIYSIVMENDNYNGHKIWVKQNVTPDCNYKMPNQYFVAYDSIQNKYAIVFMHIDRYKHFLELKIFTTIPDKIYEMSGFEDATTFDDSCTAKGFFKMYLSQKRKDNFKF